MPLWSAHSLPDRIEDSLSDAVSVFAHNELSFPSLKRILRGFNADHFSKVRRLRRTQPSEHAIGLVHDLEAPAATVLAYLITLRNEARGIIQRFFSRRKATLADTTFQVLDHTALRNDVEVAKSRLWPRQRHLVRIMEVAAGTRCASFIFPPFEILTLTRPSRSVDHERSNRTCEKLFAAARC